MRFKKTTLAALCLAFASAAAYAAAGDRFFSNPTSNKDVVIQVNKAGVTTDVIKAVGSTGAVTVGPAASTATSLKVNGDATVGNGSTGNRSLTIQGSTYAALRLADTSDANAINIRNNLSGASGEILHGATQVGSFSSAGLWTLGPSLPTSATHIINGRIRYQETNDAYPAVAEAGTVNAIANGGTYNIPIQNRFHGFVNITCNRFDSGDYNSARMWRVGVLGSASVATPPQEIGTAMNGSSGACAFTLTTPGFGLLRITNSGSCLGTANINCHWFVTTQQVD